MSDSGFFTESLSSRDPELFGAITLRAGPSARRNRADRFGKHRLGRRDGSARFSVLTNKYAEGYPRPSLLWRMPICADVAENLAIDRAKAAFRL